MNIKRPEYLLFGFTFLVLLFIGLSTDTTGDNGDSVMHYLFSHYAFDYPQHFLDHWAKPFFVLLSAPFAAFGFKGMILFNVLCVSFTGLLSYYVAKHLQLKHAWLVFPLLMGAPLFFKLTFSGLTEYLFGLMLILGIYLAQKNKPAIAMIIISLLPMVRSEGLIVVGVFGLYCLIKKHYKLIPLLLTGQVVYTLIGAVYYQDLLWIINKIPYANMDSPYGQGELLDFVFRLMYVVEKPLMLLFLIGTISWTYELFSKKNFVEKADKYILVAGSFVALFGAHTIFWWQGIFNSMGLARVLIVVVPIVIIVAIHAIEQLTNVLSSRTLQLGSTLGIMLIVLGFPFTPKDNGITYESGMFAIEDHQAIDTQVATYMNRFVPDHPDRKIFFSHPYLSIALNVDYFDTDKHLEMQHLSYAMNPGDLVIWDSWFSVSDGLTNWEDVNNNPHLSILFESLHETKEGDIRFVIFEVTN